MKKLWFEFIYEDFYCYKNKNEKFQRVMHNPRRLFSKTEGIKKIQGKIYHIFTIIGPTKHRDNYCDSEQDYNIWISVLKKATGYTNILDIYDIK